MKTNKKYILAGLAALVLTVLIIGNVHATTYCKVGTKTYTPGTYTFSNGKWICQTDGEWKKVQTQSYKCKVGTTSYNPGTHGFASGVWICQTNGKWTKAQNQPSTWTCYNGFTCYKKNGKTYATKSGTRWYYSNGKWYKDTKLTTKSTSDSTNKVTGSGTVPWKGVTLTDTEEGSSEFRKGVIIITGIDKEGVKQTAYIPEVCESDTKVLEHTINRVEQNGEYKATYYIDSRVLTCPSDYRCVDGACVHRNL